MKETKITKRIFAVFVAFIVILLISCGDLQVFADSVSWPVLCRFSSLTATLHYTSSEGSGTFSCPPSSTTSCSLPLGVVITIWCSANNGGQYQPLMHGSSSSNALLSTSSLNPTVLSSLDDLIIIHNSYNVSSSTRYYVLLDYNPATPTPEPTPTPIPDLSYLLPNSDISLYSLTLDNFNNNVDPVAISSSSSTSSHIYAFSAPDVEVYSCFVNDKFYYFTKDDRALSSSVGIAESDFMDRLVSIHVSDSLILYPLTSVKYGYFPDYIFTAAEKNSSFITFSSLAEAASFYDTYITEPTYTPEPPTASPEPSWDPDQPTYYTFFNHLLNDGNNALNALYLSWTSANNKFYTGIFFIGLPIMIGIFGIVASIFFGGDD